MRAALVPALLTAVLAAATNPPNADFFFFFNTGNNVGYAVTADDKKIAIQITPPAINLYFMAFIHIFLILIFIFIL